jgi:hypothetical protein
VSTETLAKALAIHKAGGVEAVWPGRYLVTSTSGNEYLVDIKRDRCECPSTTTCSHRGAVELYRSARRKRLAASPSAPAA